jgi:siroheme synthase-like protein
MECAYDAGLLKDALLVYACTDDKELNRRICDDGRKWGALVCAADDPSNCDFVSPAIFRSGEMSVAVSSNGLNAKKTVQWRNAIRQFATESLEKTTGS